MTLAASERHRRRLVMTDDAGEPFLLDLPRPMTLRDGDGLVLDTGGILAVRAANEPVADLYADGATALARLAWHLGNRHTPIQLLPGGAIRIADDAVLAQLAEALAARVYRHHAPFEPEPGAYAVGAHSHESDGEG